ncbi:MAG: sulfotransferase, partial [Nitrososphaerales archaeon]
MMPTAHRIAVHIGFHRTGTTWLQNTAFCDHPGLFPFMGTSSFGAIASSPFLREIVFTRESRFDATRARDAYRTQIESRAVSPTKVALISAERLSGNAASGGFDALRIARRLRDVLEDAKVFWILRHQADAIPSEYKALVRAGWPGSVRSTLAQEPRLRTVGFHLAYWEYDSLASAYARLFGPERIKIIDYGEFTRRPRQVLDDLANFLEIDRWNLTDGQLSKRLNVSESDPQVRLRQRLNHWRRSELNPYPP